MKRKRTSLPKISTVDSTFMHVYAYQEDKMIDVKMMNSPTLSGGITCQFSAYSISAFLCPGEFCKRERSVILPRSDVGSVSHRPTPA